MELNHRYVKSPYRRDDPVSVSTYDSTKAALDELEKWLKSITTAFDQHVKDEPPEYSAMAVMSGSIEDAHERITRVDDRLETLEAKYPPDEAPPYICGYHPYRTADGVWHVKAHGFIYKYRDSGWYVESEAKDAPERGFTYCNECDYESDCKWPKMGYQCCNRVGKKQLPDTCEPKVDAPDNDGIFVYCCDCTQRICCKSVDRVVGCVFGKKLKPKVDASEKHTCKFTNSCVRYPCGHIHEGRFGCYIAPEPPDTCGTCGRPARWDDSTFWVVCYRDDGELHLKSTLAPACPHYDRRKA